MALIEDLFLRHVFMKRCSTLDLLSRSMGLSYAVVEKVFRDLRSQRVLDVTGMVGDDYNFTLTTAGRTMAQARCQMCQYAGPAPVSLRSYQRAIAEQKAHLEIDEASLRSALGDMVLSGRLIDQLGPALMAHNSMFLFGPSGTGKSSLAERLVRVYGDHLMIPYSVEVDGQIIGLYDPAVHHRVDTDTEDVDPRWIACRRPCVIVGGELVGSMLELRFDSSSGTYAAPVQMKANGGMLVIDDFGRQVISPRDLLNRWIVPLDRRKDYLSLNYGLRFEIPFELMVVFSTNLDPAELADEAFLRRIPNKIRVDAVSADAFDEIFRRILAHDNIACDDGGAAYLRQICIARGGGLRACYPGDMCEIIVALKRYEQQPLRITGTDLDRAASLMFGDYSSPAVRPPVIIAPDVSAPAGAVQ
jgi:hypothetical protein